MITPRTLRYYLLAALALVVAGVIHGCLTR
jgi:hypothetical protein